MSWNHRILAHDLGVDIEFQIHEVYYDENGVPYGYTQKPIPVCSDTIKGIKWTLRRMLESTKKPILWAGDKFPNEYEIK